MNDTRDDRAQRQGWGILATDQSTVAIITALALAAIVASWAYRGGLRGRMIDIDATAPVEVAFQLDINHADWPEWTLLPGIGETMAKRIVQHRSERGPFQHHTDLLQVSGVGPRTFERMRPHLLPLPASDDQREQDTVGRE